MKKNEVKQVSVIKVKKQVLELLETLEATLDSEKNDVMREYKVVGKSTKQATGWRKDENGEYPLLWEDEAKTIPVYEDEYGYVDKTEEDLTEEDKIKLEAIETIRKALYSLI